MSNALIFNIPYVFELSANALIIAEEVDQSLFTHHLVFALDCSGLDISASTLENLFLIGNSENDDKIFFSRADNTHGEQSNPLHFVSNFSRHLASVILKDGNLLFDNSLSDKKIPIGPAVLNQDPSQNYFNLSVSDFSGNTYDEILLRTLAIHLIGNPFSRAWIQNEGALRNQVKSDDKVHNLSSQFNKLLGGDSSGNILKSDSILGHLNTNINTKQNISDGVANNVLKLFFESMVADISNNETRRNKIQNMSNYNPNDLSLNQTYVYGLPFLPGDKIVVFIRNTINIAVEPVSGNLLPSIHIKDIFPGGASNDNVPAEGRWGWMGFSTDISNNGIVGSYNLSQQTTDISGNGATNIFDAHVWKITLTLI